MAKELRFDSRQEQDSLLFTASTPTLKPTMPSTVGKELQKREADHSLSHIAEVKNDGARLPLPILLHGVVLN
jgi:hypothetical protein